MDYTFLSRFIYIYFASVSYVFAVIMFIIVGYFSTPEGWPWEAWSSGMHSGKAVLCIFQFWWIFSSFWTLLTEQGENWFFCLRYQRKVQLAESSAFISLILLCHLFLSLYTLTNIVEPIVSTLSFLKNST